MIYAVLSDMHGNFPAFRAVVDDAKLKGAQAFLLLGDYMRDSPFSNEVVDTIRSLPNCTAILGNGDIGVISLNKTRLDRCEYEQMLPNFWTYKNLSQINLEFLLSLPETANIELESGKRIHLSHSIPLIGHSPRLGAFHSGDYSRKMEKTPFTFQEGMHAMQASADEYAQEVADYPGDICLFGHNHLQFLGEVADKILLDPGSCGLPLDYDTRAPYAIIDDDGASPKLELHRVKYDVNDTINAVSKFDAFPHAEFWGKLNIAMLRSASDIAMNRFWNYARSIGNGKFPMENDTWRRVVSEYEFEMQNI